MIAGSIGRRWAKALLEIAQEKKRVEKILIELERFYQVLLASEDLKIVLTDASFSAGPRKKVLAQLVGPLGLSDDLHRFLKLLIDRERIEFFESILISYREMADEFLGRVRVKVTAAEALPPAEQEKLKEILEKKTGRRILLETRVNPEILGGTLIHLKDEVFDGSIRSALLRLKEQIERLPIHS